MNTVISVEHLSKTYRLGQISTGTFTDDLNIWWAKVRGMPNPMLRIGEQDYVDRDDEELLALKDVSFTVGQGEVLGIIGRNGAGKSTLLKILSRVTAPTSGRIRVRGRVASLLEVGTGFHPELTGRENIFLNGVILGLNRYEVATRFSEIVAFAEVEKFIDTPVKRYSSGMYVRLAFAIAAHLDPEILVVDEVLAVGDEEFQKKCLGKMENVASQGRTVLFVSHNMHMIQKLCQKAIWLNNGEVHLEGPSVKVVNSYLQPKKHRGSRVDLENVEHNGSGEAFIKFVRILDEGGMEKITFSMGECMMIEFGIETELPSTHLTYAVEVKDPSGYPILHLWDVDCGRNVLRGKVRIVRAKIQNTPLYPGNYNISLWTGLDNGWRVDRVEDCISFSVNQSIGAIRQFSRDRGAIHYSADWDYESITSKWPED